MKVPTTIIEWLIAFALLGIAIVAFLLYRSLFVQHTDSNGKVTTKLRLTRSSIPNLPNPATLKEFAPTLKKSAKPSPRRLKAYAQMYRYQSLVAALALYLFGLCLLYMAVQSLFYSNTSLQLINTAIRFLTGIGAIVLSVIAFNHSRKNNPFKF